MKICVFTFIKPQISRTDFMVVVFVCYEFHLYSKVPCHFMRGCVPGDVAYFKARIIQDKFSHRNKYIAEFFGGEEVGGFALFQTLSIKRVY
jgi:hypothetical protein